MTPQPPNPPDAVGYVPARPPPLPKKRSWVLWLVLGAPLLGCLFFTVIAMIAGGSASVPSNSVLKITLDGAMPERNADEEFSEIFGKTPLTVRDHLDNLKKAAADKRIKGVVLRLEMPAIGWAKVEELRDALAEFKKSGKFVIAYSEYLDEKTYSLALMADEVLMAPDSFFEFNGFSSDVLHYPGLLEKLGIQVQYFRYGKYKSVSGESFGRKALTEPVKEMINSTLDAQFGLFVDQVAATRKLTTDEVKALIANPGLHAEWAVEKKLIDGISYWDEIEAKLKKRLTLAEKDKLSFISANRYRHVSPTEAGIPEPKHTFALVYSQGLVVAGKGGVDPFSGDDSQGSTPIIEAMRKAADDDKVKAIIFRVDSPGGAGLGCDLVRREVERLRAKKPIIVSMGDMAASGGYWVSMDATAIVAQPSTYTGSIGIWSVVPNLKQTYEKLDLNQEVFNRGEHADSLNGSRPMSDDEAKVFDTALKASYDRFVELAAKGRKKTHEQLDEVAQGRTWLGKIALEKGLVDKLGGFEAAIALGKEKANLPQGEAVKLVPYETKKSFVQQLLEKDDEDDLAGQALNQAISHAMEVSGLRAVVAPASGLSTVARALLQKRETLFPMAEYQLNIH
jgi:protease IV